MTNLETDSRAVVRFYIKRGTAEQWIKEGKQAMKMTRLSCHRLVLLKKIENWSLTSPQRRRFGSMVRRIAALPLPAG